MEELVVVVTCLLLNALFAAYEMAFVSAPKSELRGLARTGDKNAQRLLLLRDHPERTLSIIQIGITLVGVVSAGVAGAGAAENLEPFFIRRFGMGDGLAEVFAIFLVVLPIAFLSVVIGELVPKTLALRNPVKITLKGARWLFIADRLLSPAVTLFEWSTKQVIRIFFKRSKPAASVSEAMVEIDSLAQHHQQAVLNLAHIERKQLKDILVPWKDVTFVRSNDTMEDVVPIIFASGHTRLPVVDDGNIAGVLHTKEFLAYRETGGEDWKSIVRPILRAQAPQSVLSTLRLMQSKRSHMAVVLSTEGERLGIVTFEDISMEIWGDIYDEDEDSRIRRIFADRVKGKMLPPAI